MSVDGWGNTNQQNIYNSNYNYLKNYSSIEFNFGTYNRESDNARLYKYSIRLLSLTWHQICLSCINILPLYLYDQGG